MLTVVHPFLENCKSGNFPLDVSEVAFLTYVLRGSYIDLLTNFAFLKRYHCP